MAARTINRISKLLIKKAALHVCRTVMVLRQEFDLDVNSQIAEKCLAESITMEWLIIDTLYPDQYNDQKTAIVNSILDTTEAYLRKGWKTRQIGEWFIEYFQSAVTTYPIPESIFSADYRAGNYLSGGNPPQNSIINHFMERIADLLDIPDSIPRNIAVPADRETMDLLSTRSTLAMIKAVISLLADNHMKHLLIEKPLIKFLSAC